MLLKRLTGSLVPSPRQLAFVLQEVLLKQKKELTKPVYPEDKMAWIRATAQEVLNFIEKEYNKFNKLNSNNKLVTRDLVSVIQTALNVVLRTYSIKLKKD